MPVLMEDLPDIRQQILYLIKQEGKTTIAALAERLQISYEAVRQHIRLLEMENLIAQEKLGPERGQKTGRPLRYYALTQPGEHLFPKNYDDLAVGLIDAITSRLEPESLRQVLAALTDSQVRGWEPRLRGLTLAKRLEALKDVYLREDPFTTVEDGLRLVERNCPFLNVAMRRPDLCSVTVSTLARLLGYRVVREKRFQNGDGRCIFRVLTDQPIDPASFEFEFELQAG